MLKSLASTSSSYADCYVKQQRYSSGTNEGGNELNSSTSSSIDESSEHSHPATPTPLATLTNKLSSTGMPYEQSGYSTAYGMYAAAAYQSSMAAVPTGPSNTAVSTTSSSSASSPTFTPNQYQAIGTLADTCAAAAAAAHWSNGTFIFFSCFHFYCRYSLSINYYFLCTNSAIYHILIFPIIQVLFYIKSHDNLRSSNN